MEKGCREGWNPPVWGVCACLFLGALWVPHMEVRVHSCSGNIQLLVPWGLGHLCKVSEHLTALSHVIFGLSLVNHHWWVHFFWLVARTDAHKDSLFLMSGSCLGPLGEVPSYWFVTLRVCGTWCMCHVGVIFSVFSLFCYVVMGEKVIIIIFITTGPALHLFVCRWVWCLSAIWQCRVLVPASAVLHCLPSPIILWCRHLCSWRWQGQCLGGLWDVLRCLLSWEVGHQVLKQPGIKLCAFALERGC